MNDEQLIKECKEEYLLAKNELIIRGDGKYVQKNKKRMGR